MKNQKYLLGRPNMEQAPVYFHYYFQLTSGENDLETTFEKNRLELEIFIQSIPAEKADYRYAAGKWSIKGVISHCIETERILQYRALCFSRKDQTTLPGFDENWYVDQNNHSSLSLDDLCKEFHSVRMATLSLYQGMNSEMLDFVGTANHVSNTARSIGWFILGHVVHHTQIIQERYL